MSRKPTDSRPSSAHPAVVPHHVEPSRPPREDPTERIPGRDRAPGASGKTTAASEFSRDAEGITDLTGPRAEPPRAELPRISVVIHHGDEAEIVPLHPGARMTIGRVPEADITVPAPTLSRQHARIELVGGGLWIEDLNSRNGVSINGKSVQRQLLRPGDDVVLGAVRLSVHTTASYARGFEHHARFISDLDEELTRSRAFGHPLALLFLTSADGLGDWCDRVRQTLRPVDRAGVQPGGIVEILLPECGATAARQRAERLLAGEPSLCAALVVPDPKSRAPALLARGLALLARADDQQRLHVDVATPRRVGRRTVTPVSPGEAKVVAGEVMRQLYATVRRIAPSDRPVLLYGETGVGKEVVAHAIHRASGRAHAPLRSINCGAIHRELVQSALFGHERGSFTGASQRARGVFEQANRGTLLLDEVGELPLEAQVALLRVLETQRVTRVGAGEDVAVNVRIIAATNRDLEAMCAAGSFRWDLFYRLETLTLRVPPLRERPDEIIPLAEYFAAAGADAAGHAARPLANDLRDVLLRYQWPGNVRELRNAIERAVLVATGETIDVADLPARVRRASVALEPALHVASGHTMLLRDPTPHLGTPIYELDRQARRAATASSGSSPVAGGGSAADRATFKQRVLDFERRCVAGALAATEFNRRAAAEALRMPLRTLMSKVRSYDFSPASVGAMAASGELPSPPGADDARSFRERLHDLERELLVEAIAAEGGNKAAAARRLALPLSTLHYKLRALDIT